MSTNYSLADDARQAELSDLKSAIKTVQRNIATESLKHTALEKELQSIEVKHSKISSKVGELSRKINIIKNRISTRQREKSQLKKSIERQEQVITEELLSAHKIGDQEPIKLLLNQEDPQKIARIFKYYDYFLKARSEKIDSYSRDVSTLTKIIQEINRQKLDLIGAKNSLKIQQTDLKNSATIREKTLTKIKGTLDSDEANLAHLKKQRAQLEILLHEVQEAVENIVLPQNMQPFASKKGTLTWPITGLLIDQFGSRRKGPIRSQGWLISSAIGNPVTAVHAGRVVFSDYLRGFGLLLIIDHSDGYMTLYGHNQELLKDTGGWVMANETIARSGNTGGLSSPALYFEIRQQGKPKNPKFWLKGA
ncbi:MAG: peptidoglycan DD-metalloendopeptidase family protein [Porticoccaceae bacterium]|nr:peptidoglycan DD-metalloendopeptidase family protein [Porticoccaceae bacterium]